MNYKIHPRPAFLFLEGRSTFVYVSFLSQNCVPIDSLLWIMVFQMRWWPSKQTIQWHWPWYHDLHSYCHPTGSNHWYWRHGRSTKQQSADVTFPVSSSCWGSTCCKQCLECVLCKYKKHCPSYLRYMLFTRTFPTTRSHILCQKKPILSFLLRYV